MNERIKILIENFENICGRNEFLKKLEIYFSENFNSLDFEIIKLMPFPPYYLTLADSQPNKSLLATLSESNNIEQKNKLFIIHDYYIYPLTENTIAQYSLIFKNLSDNNFDEINSLCIYIHSLYKLVVNNYHFGFEESSLQNANLISQMIHDINSMISLIKMRSSQIEESVSNKMSYAEKMTKDALQYVREIQVLDSEVKIKELLEGIIQNVSFPDNIDVSIQNNVNEKTINLDVELIDRALNEIIQNAVSAFGDTNGRISIKTDIRQFKNILYNNEYLEIKVEDNGIGINSDFLSFIKNPYFTTRKSEYHSGLGLSIADKIIDAHGGYLNIEITPENKTAVTIYLPLQGNDNE